MCLVPTGSAEGTGSLELQGVVNHLAWVEGTELVSSGKGPSSLSHRAISLYTADVCHWHGFSLAVKCDAYHIPMKCVEP